MCVIIRKKNNVKIDKKELINAYLSNPDGFGILQNGKAPIYGEKIADLMNFCNQHLTDENDLIFHFRISTGGDGLSNLHPFKIKLTDSPTTYLFHNGICGKSDGKKSDTHQLADSLSGTDFDSATEVLKVLNENGKGKFILCSVDFSKYFEVGIEYSKDGIGRSNENHIPYINRSSSVSSVKSNYIGGHYYPQYGRKSYELEE